MVQSAFSIHSLGEKRAGTDDVPGLPADPDGALFGGASVDALGVDHCAQREERLRRGPRWRHRDLLPADLGSSPDPQVSLGPLGLEAREHLRGGVAELAGQSWRLRTRMSVEAARSSDAWAMCRNA